jgi:ABC-type phosphate transport system substrate-binding protein
MDGSATVLPVSRKMADAFQQRHPAVKVAAQSSGTGGGFRKFCAGDVDVTAASRPINAAESQACLANHVEFIELPVAFDSLSVVVNAKNMFVGCLPLSRPMFVYISRSAAARPEAKAFARFCVDPENAGYVRDVGYVPLPAVTLLAAARHRADTAAPRLYRWPGISDSAVTTARTRRHGLHNGSGPVDSRIA